MFIISAVMMFNKTMVEDWAEDAWKKAKLDNPNIESLDKYKKELMDNIDIVAYAFMGFTVMIACTFVFGWCYRCSTVGRTEEKREKLIEQ